MSLIITISSVVVSVTSANTVEGRYPGMARHPVASGLIVEPGLHVVQELEPVLAVYVPALHVEQTVPLIAPNWVWYVPGLHPMQVDIPCPVPYVPILHFVHVDEPSSME